MPLLLTPTQPLRTACGLPVARVYALVNLFALGRETRTARFQLGYYVDEAASHAGSGFTQLSLPLPAEFSFQVNLDQLGQLGDPTEVLEAYATSELLPLLGEGATITQVP